MEDGAFGQFRESEGPAGVDEPEECLSCEGDVGFGDAAKDSLISFVEIAGKAAEGGFDGAVGSEAAEFVELTFHPAEPGRKDAC